MYLFLEKITFRCRFGVRKDNLIRLYGEDFDLFRGWMQY
jgi:hypothetical protein